MNATVERKWAARKINVGDYILPSNDQQTLWRLRAYDEDGSGPARGRYWELWRWAGDVSDEVAIADSIIERNWDRWELVASVIRTRADAIEEALRIGAGES